MDLPNSGAMLRAPMDTKQIQMMAAEILQMVVVGIDRVAMRGGI